jgi:hypothetical protein
MRQTNLKNQATAAAAACAAPAFVEQSSADPAACLDKPCVDKACVDQPCLDQACAGHAAARSAGPRDMLRAALDKGRALLRVYFHSRKVRAAANALAQALAESREASSWPGDRLPVGEEMSAQVEKLTRRLSLETEAHNRLEALFKSVELGRSAAAV